MRERNEDGESLSNYAQSFNLAICNIFQKIPLDGGSGANRVRCTKVMN